MKICLQCNNVAILNCSGICDACQNDEDEYDQWQAEIVEERRNGEIE